MANRWPEGSSTRTATSVSEELALTLLARDGIAAIWQLNIAAAESHRNGYHRAADTVLQIADAAEQAWLRAEGTRVLFGSSERFVGRHLRLDSHDRARGGFHRGSRRVGLGVAPIGEQSTAENCYRRFTI